MKEHLTSLGPEETHQFGRQLAARLPKNGVLLLEGDLGTGKTVLTQGLGEGLGFDPRRIQSPSYTLISEYENGSQRLVHVDLYRLDAADLPALGLEELLAGPGTKVVEWAERLDFPVPGAWRLRLSRGESEDGNARILDITTDENTNTMKE